MTLGKEQDRDDGGFLSRWSRRKALVRQGAVVAEPEVVVAPVVPAAPVAPAGTPVARAEPGALRPAGLPQPGVPVDAPAVQAASAPLAAAPLPTLADVAALTAESDYARFVAPGVDRGVKNAALKKLFTNPHFNIMDGLDTYIDDYGKPDPLPAGMLRQMAQSHALGLFADDPAQPPVVPAAAAHSALPADGAPDPALPTDAAADPALAADEAAVPPINANAYLPETLPPPKPIPHENAALRLQPHDAAGPAGPGPGTGPHAGRQH
jgi:hypothetical protein